MPNLNLSPSYFKRTLILGIATPRNCWSTRTYTHVRPQLHAVTHQANLQQETY